jgi:hypothetical protein
MKLFSLNKDKLDPINGIPFKLERDIQNLIENNTSEIFDLEFVSSEFRIGDFRIDSLCFDNETNSFVIIEYKKGSSYSVIDQGYSYLSIMLNNKSDFILEYNEKSSNNLKRGSINWSQSRIIFISPSFNSYQKNSVNFKDIPFELWEIKQYSNKSISLNPIISNSKESVENISNKNSGVIKDVNKEVKVISQEELLSKSSEIVKDIWYKIEDKLTDGSFVETRFNYKPGYNRFSMSNNKVICYFNFQKNKIKVDIIGGTIYGDGRYSKQFCELDDFKKISTKRYKPWKDGKTKQLEYSIPISNENEIDYLVNLIRQKYDSMS